MDTVKIRPMLLRRGRGQPGFPQLSLRSWLSPTVAAVRQETPRCVRAALFFTGVC